MIKKIISVIVLAVVALGLYSLGQVIKKEPAQGKLPDGSTAVGSFADIQDTKWIWTQTVMNDGSTVLPKKPLAFTFVLSSEGNVNGTTDCNGFFGTYEAGTDGVIAFGPLASTKMFCEGAQEGEFMKTFSGITRYTFDETGNLVFLLPYDSGSMIFKKVASHDVTLSIGATETVVDDISLTLNSFVSDNRCPVDVQCIEAGAVVVNVTMKKGTAVETRNFPSDEVPYVFMGHSFAITQITPVANSKVTIDPKDYKITFRVE